MRYFDKVPKFVIYSFWGGIVTLIDIVLICFFHEYLLLNLYVSTSCSFVLTVLLGYFFQKYITFYSGYHDTKKYKQFLQFFVVNLFTQVIFSILLYCFINVFNEHGYMFSVFCAKGIVFIINYLMHSFFTFRLHHRKGTITVILFAFVLFLYLGKNIFQIGIDQNIFGFLQGGIPQRASNIVWYHIIPDRRRNGDMNNDAKTIPAERNMISSQIGERRKGGLQSRTGDRVALTPTENALKEALLETNLWLPKSARGNVLRNRWYGGDFTGMRNHIDYLSELGINGVFLNPIRKANTPMRYDVIDYRYVDERLSSTSGNTIVFSGDQGTGRERRSADIDFLELVDEFHDKGIRVVIDVAFTYSSVQSLFLEDIARNGISSEYYDRFELSSSGDMEYGNMGCLLSYYYTGVQYIPAQNIRMQGWWGYCPMVYVNRSYDNHQNIHPELLDWYKKIIERRLSKKIINGKQYDGVDGIRIDAFPELPIKTKQELRKRAKSIKPEALIVGEEWNIDYNRIKEGESDSITSYTARTLSEGLMISKQRKSDNVDFLNKLIDYWYQSFSGFGWENSIRNVMNSHDTDRVISKITFSNRGNSLFPTNQDHYIAHKGHHIWDNSFVNSIDKGAFYLNHSPSKNDMVLLDSIRLLHFFLPGSPVIYYGDEVGMWGADDPNSRKPMLWEDMHFEQQSDCSFDTNEYCYDLQGVRKDDYFPNYGIYNSYKTLISLRKQSDVFRYGVMQDIPQTYGSGLVVFHRATPNDNAYFITNQEIIGGTSGKIFVGSHKETYFDPLFNMNVESHLGRLETGFIPYESSRILYTNNIIKKGFIQQFLSFFSSVFLKR